MQICYLELYYRPHSKGMGQVVLTGVCSHFGRGRRGGRGFLPSSRLEGGGVPTFQLRERGTYFPAHLPTFQLTGGGGGGGGIAFS